MQHSIGQDGFFEQPGEGHAADDRRLHIRLQDRGVAHSERCTGGVCGA
jgi:hypothetical protein